MTKRSGTGAAKCAARRFLAPEPLAKQPPRAETVALASVL
jgi:hypothetical protein